VPDGFVLRGVPQGVIPPPLFFFGAVLVMPSNSPLLRKHVEHLQFNIARQTMVIKCVIKSFSSGKSQ
jgi:hypothetical protein